MSCTVNSFAIHTRDPYSQPHKTHGVHTASRPQGTRGAYSHPHKTHGVHTARPTRHTRCIQPPPQVRTAILTRRIYIFFFMLILGSRRRHFRIALGRLWDHSNLQSRNAYAFLTDFLVTSHPISQQTTDIYGLHGFPRINHRYPWIIHFHGHPHRSMDIGGESTESMDTHVLSFCRYPCMSHGIHG